MIPGNSSIFKKTLVMHGILEFIKDQHYNIQSMLGKSTLYYHLFARKFPFSQMAVTGDTEIVIEGFPRSANSYAVVAFKLVNPRAPIGHHLHVPVQLIQACRYNIPAVLVLRAPEEAVASFMVFQGSLNADIYLKAYIRFHRLLLPYREKIIVASFETVTSDMNRVIEAINSRYDKDFSLIDSLPEREDEIFAKLKDVNARFFGNASNKSMYPDRGREKMKQLAQKKVLQSPWLVEARNLYSQLNRNAL